jgi:hypothetical protein
MLQMLLVQVVHDIDKGSEDMLIIRVQDGHAVSYLTHNILLDFANAATIASRSVILRLVPVVVMKIVVIQWLHLNAASLRVPVVSCPWDEACLRIPATCQPRNELKSSLWHKVFTASSSSSTTCFPSCNV